MDKKENEERKKEEGGIGYQPLRKTKISNFKIIPPKKSAFCIPTPEHIPSLHSLLIFNARRGGGKSVAVTNYVKKLLDSDLMDRIIILTPTWNSNKTIYEPLNIKEEDILEPVKSSVKDIIQIVEEEKKDFDEYIKMKKAYLEYKKEMQSNTPINEIPPEKMLLYHDYQFFVKKPEWKYKNEVPARIFVIIDDCLGTPLMLPSSGLVNLIIKHRHIGSGTGVSIAMLTQSYACQQGLARPIRENCCQLALFKNTDESQRKKIISEMGDVDEDKFMSMFDYATAEPYGFLFIDFNAKSPHQQFRKNFDEYLT
tara:strand:- start:694 stop:1626 length:933 start_codon:yes stop_codon:yes gene_type:complete